MFSYIVKRILWSLPTLWVIIAISFFMIRTAPGGPFDKDRPVPPEVEANLKKAYHLDDPLVIQFGRYVDKLVQGDLGPSFKYPDRTVSELIGLGFPVSFKLGMTSIFIALIIGVFLGTIAALRQNSALDNTIMFAAMTGVTIPNYVVAPVLSLVLAVYLDLLPVGGWNGGKLENMILPVTALALPQIAYIARLTRGSMIEVLRSNFIRTSRAKGLPERLTLFKHAIKPAIVPVVSYLGPATAAIITGSVVIEQIFSVPGIGSHFVKGALNRDYTLVMGVVVFYGTLIITFNLLVDLIYGLLDPKVRHV